MRASIGICVCLMLTLGGCAERWNLPRDAGGADGGEPADASVASGAQVHVHLRASHDPVAHPPATSGQTPRDWVSGIRSLHLLRSETDPAPVEIFSHGDGYVEVSYADNADTIAGSAPIATLPNATFTWARAVHTHVRFTIDATLHTSLGPAPGTLDDLIILSDRTTIDGAVHRRGDYRYVFRTGGTDYPAEGTGFTVQPIPGGGFFTRIEDGETAYYFPVYLVVSNDLTEDVHLIFEVNVHEGFRWTELVALGHETGVFDTTVISTEPIVQAGANGYAYFVE
jgi:hypothetical protein